MGKPKLTKTREKNIYSYIDVDNKKKYAYRYRYTRLDGRKSEVYKSNFATMKAAALALIEKKSDILKGDYNKIDYAHLTLDQLFKIFTETKAKDMKPNTLKNYNYTFKNVSPYIGKMRVRDLTKMEYIRRYVRKVEDTINENTLATYTSRLQSVINFAVNNELLDKNRLKGLSYSKDSETIIFDDETLSRILSYAKHEKPRMYPVILFLASTGVRAGESLGLKWCDVDFEENTAHINCTRQNANDETTPKTKNSYRHVHLSNEMQRVLKAERNRQKASLLSEGIRCTDKDFGKRYIFRNRDGNPLSYHSLLLFFRKMKINNGISTHPHVFRHTFASVLIGEGVDVATVASLLGDTIATVQKIYIHAIDSKRDDAAAKMAQYLEKVGTKVGTE